MTYSRARAATDDLFQEYPATDFEALAPRSLDRRFAAEWLRGCDGTVVPALSWRRALLCRAGDLAAAATG